MMKFITAGKSAKTIKNETSDFRKFTFEKNQSVSNNSFTMESLILAQDER